MVSIYESLEKLGLTRNEVTIYKYLLRKGLSSGAQIWAENSMDKSSAYRAIGQLQEKRLVYAIGETRNQKFAANPVEYLYELHQKVEDQLTEVKTDIEKFVEDINEYAKQNYKSSRIQVFEGDKGYKLFSKQRLSGSVELLRQIAPTDTGIQGLDKLNQEFIKERVKKGVPIKLMYGVDFKELPGAKDFHSDDIQLKEVRKVNINFGPSVGATTHGDSISIFTREDGIFMGLVLKDRLITGLFNSLFDSIWDTGVKV